MRRKMRREIIGCLVYMNEWGLRGESEGSRVVGSSSSRVVG